MMRLLLFDTAFRLLAAGQLLLIALVIARAQAPRAIRLTTVALLLCVAAYLANVAPMLNLPNAWFWPPVQLASQSAPFFLWLFAHQIFERPVAKRLAWVAAAVTIVCWAMFMAAFYWTHRWPTVANAAQHLLSGALALHAIWIAVRERGDDLIEKRRMFRTGFVVVVGVQVVGIVVAESWYGMVQGVTPLLLLQSATTLVAVMAFGAVLLSGNGELLFDASAAPPPRPALSPPEQVLKLKLDAAMADGAWRESGLTIGLLADKLGTPEHRLRALINQRLGYRNFSAFLNAHRIAEARAWLSDPARVDLPVLTIAMDLGYGSLAPFNRAFRDATGKTPTDYRRASFADPEKA